jgi:hypothetical protein
MYMTHGGATNGDQGLALVTLYCPSSGNLALFSPLLENWRGRKQCKHGLHDFSKILNTSILK